MIRKIWKHFTKNLNNRKITAVLLGNIIAGIGIAILRFSLMGNDPYSAMNMALSDGFSMGLGTFQLLLNLLFLIIQLLFGRDYIGFGTIINMCFLGYIVQYSGIAINGIFGSMENCLLIERVLVMLLSLVVLGFGLSMYQVADLGVAPFDYLSLGLAKRTKRPYFLFRVLTDAGCIIVILIAFFCGLFPFCESHIGIGTVACAFCLGPIVNVFMKVNRGWITKNGKTKKK